MKGLKKAIEPMGVRTPFQNTRLVSMMNRMPFPGMGWVKRLRNDCSIKRKHGDNDQINVVSNLSGNTPIPRLKPHDAITGASVLDAVPTFRNMSFGLLRPLHERNLIRKSFRRILSVCTRSPKRRVLEQIVPIIHIILNRVMGNMFQEWVPRILHNVFSWTAHSLLLLNSHTNVTSIYFSSCH
eukprot:scaffold13125_cov78-Skeletonema_menzelii.AAC.1